MNSIFTQKAWAEYLAWQIKDKKTLKRINLLLAEIKQNGTDDKLEELQVSKGKNCYSKRIDDKNRLIYNFNKNGDVEIISCKGHYKI